MGDHAEERRVRAFVGRGDTAVAKLDANERAVVSRLVAEVGALLGEDAAEGGQVEPSDPALLRLLPNASPTDPEVADEFRRLTESDLRALKASRLRKIEEDLGGEGSEWVVPIGDAMSTAAALTDVRLVVASRLGLETDEDADLLKDELEMTEGLLEHGLPEGLDVDHERLWLATMYQALTWLQDSLVACVMNREGGSDE
jgi:hypothetical protein